MADDLQRELSIADLQARIREHRRILAGLEEQLHALHGERPQEIQGANVTSRRRPTQVAEPETPPRVHRMVRTDLRRAARQATGAVDRSLVVATPVRENGVGRYDEVARDLAAARKYNWVRTSLAAAALDDGARLAAAEILTDILRTEEAISATVDGLALGDAWRGVQDELERGSDMVIDAARRALGELAAGVTPDAGSVVTPMRTGQSNWLRAWPVLVQVLPAA